MEGAVQGGIILAVELVPSAHLNIEHDGGWRDAGSTLRIGVKLYFHQALRERVHKARERPPAVMVLGHGDKNVLGGTSTGQLVSGPGKQLGELINHGQCRLGSYFSSPTTYFIISSLQVATSSETEGN